MSFAVHQEITNRRLAGSEDFSRAMAGHLVSAPAFRWKDLPGRCLALVLLVLAAPVVLLTMLAVRLTSPGPTIFRQTRVGRHGRIYVMYKIRSMRMDAEAATGPVWAARNDPRITGVGRCIRTLHLDEFPQLINVVKGEMALIGPRPERPEFVARLAREIPAYLDRLAVLPGITGLAQIKLPPDSDLDSVRRKLAVDLDYIQHGSAWLDLRILACTFVRLFGVKGDHASRLFRLYCRPGVADRQHVACEDPPPAAQHPNADCAELPDSLAPGVLLPHDA